MENPKFAEIKLWFLGTVGLIESAMKIPFRNPNFIALTLITSFPLFCMRLIHELPYNYQPSLIKEAIYQLGILTHDGGNMSPLLLPGCPTRLSRGLHLIVYGVAFAKWAEYSAWWNLSVVVSILEENRGIEAISASSKLTKGNRLRGLIWMLLYSVWRFKLPSVLATWTFPHILASYYLDTSFVCLGKVINWVVLTVYYYDCKTVTTRLP
ncbi:hypothetical protein PRUPE_1G255800 [Prunus persica]|uniref:Uncharacterized protein n=1 Tax=Prunus persica TaxID=3760 RepID=A0A251R3F2_PRUPE|nr:hypothetical protein PRUPE_1G255800 [Prunus persica]